MTLDVTVPVLYDIHSNFDEAVTVTTVVLS